MDEGTLQRLVAREAIFDVVRLTAARLDAEDLEGWLDLFAAESEYEITAHGPEIRADMAWWKSDRDALAGMLAEVREHVRDPGRRLHVVAPLSAEPAGDRASALSHFAILRTAPDGHSAVYAAGRYDDILVREGGRWLYRRHRVVLDTRMLEPFTHLPL